MARSGSGVFASDTASDFVGDLVGELVAQVEYAVAEPSRLEPDEYYGEVVPCLIVILAALHQLTGTAAIPDPKVVAGWKAKYMEVWEAYLVKHGFEPREQRARRAVLKAAFDRLERLSRRMHAEDAEPRAVRRPALRRVRGSRKP